jgi:hypothetical protein
MNPEVKPDLIITPVTWENQKQHLGRTASQLLNLVGWFGSTHSMAMWRNDPQFLAPFREKGVVSFNPQLTEEWHPSFAQTEAEVFATASVILIRLENNELLNGSLGSIAEIGLALTSAVLRGQIVVVSIEEGLLVSLSDSGAIAQYMLLEMYLEDIDKNDDLDSFLWVHRGDDLHELASIACEVALQQTQTPQKRLNYKSFQAKKTKRGQNYPLRVLLGGSGGPYSKVYQDNFRRKKKLLAQSYLAEGHPVKVLSEGAIAAAWNIPYGSLDKYSVSLATRTLWAIEIEFKQEADVLLLPIMAESTSKAAATEIGFLLLHALTTGQDVKIYIEPFDPVDYIRYQLSDVDIPQIEPEEKQARLVLRRAGVADSILAVATQEEILETFAVFKALSDETPPTFKAVKHTLLGKTEAFANADNTRRVRVLVEAHLDRLTADENFPNFFTCSDKIE